MDSDCSIHRQGRRSTAAIGQSPGVPSAEDRYVFSRLTTIVVRAEAARSRCPAVKDAEPKGKEGSDTVIDPSSARAVVYELRTHNQSPWSIAGRGSIQSVTRDSFGNVTVIGAGRASYRRVIFSWRMM